MTSLGSMSFSLGSSTGDISPSIRLSLLNPTAAEIHTPLQRLVKCFVQNSDHVLGSWVSLSSDFVAESAFSPRFSSRKRPSKSGSMSSSPATSLQGQREKEKGK